MKLIVVFRNYANAPKKPYFEQKGCLLHNPNMQGKGSDCVCVRACKLSYIIQDRGSTEVTATCYLRVVGGNAVDIAEVQHR
jgi:hypothetical protein